MAEREKHYLVQFLLMLMVIKVSVCGSYLTEGCPEIRDYGNLRANLVGGHPVYQGLYSIGSEVRFSCTHGNVLIGSPTIRCQPNGSYNEATPRCGCVYPGTITHGYYIHYNSKQPYTDGPAAIDTDIQAMCDAGYTIRNVYRRCTSSGYWDSDQPICTAVVCKRLRNFQNGQFQYRNVTSQESATYSFGTTAVVVCNAGYVAVQQDSSIDFTTKCSESGQWLTTGNTPTCEKACIIPNLTNGRYKSVNVNQDGTHYIFPECYEGYILRPDDKTLRACRQAQTWSGHNYTCNAITCLTQTLQPRHNYEIINSPSTVPYGVTIRTRCKAGHERLSGDIKRTCEADRTFNGIELVCKPITCSAQQLQPRQHSNEIVIPSSTVPYGVNITTWCTTGYEQLSGDTIRTCMADGRFSGTELKCSKITCLTQPLRSNEHSYVIISYPPLVTYGDNITTRCITGHEQIRGDTTRTCQADGTFSGTELECTLITCQTEHLQPSQYHYEIVNSSSSVTYGNNITSRCTTGHEQNRGDTIRTCQADKTFSGAELMCKIIRCSLESLEPEMHFYEFGEDLGTNIEYGSTISAVCTSGYEHKSGHLLRHCRENGTLSGDEPTCAEIYCSTDGLLPEKHFYEIVNSGTTGVPLGSNITTTCKPGYVQHGGNSTRTCQKDKSFSGMETICIAIVSPDAYTSVSLAAVVGGASGAVVLLVAIGFVVFIVKRRKNKEKSEDGTVRMSDVQTTSSSGLGVYSEISLNERGEGQSADLQDNAYYCFTNTDFKLPEKAIKLEDLADFVLNAGEENVKYKQEFQSLPEGMTKPHLAAMKNRRKNRYRNLYAYDDTRVVLDVWDVKTETDYINACYIHGFSQSRAYIASQGPTDDILADFWRMVWQTDCGKIVMLTNLWEEGKDKCVQYWPTSGVKNYGRVTVTLEQTETFSNFVIRTLIEKRGNLTRQVLHFHFTAWPDRGVPKFTSALVHFRNKVKNTPTACKGPTVVHCSAGIGRTGTYIALDFLTEQGRALGAVDVAGCVETLRRQRVNMVQTQEQYVFVHEALVETLMVSTSALSAAQFPYAFRKLLGVDPVTQKTRIQVEFELLRTMAPMADESQYSTAKEVQHRDKNRFANNLPMTEFMPSLYGCGSSPNSGFINATFLPSFKEPNALIAAQTPLASTKEDFWMMVFYQEVHTIIMMNEQIEMKDTEVYWPELKESVKYGNFEVSCIATEQQGGHTILTLVLDAQTKARTLKLFQSGGWCRDERVPASPYSVLACMEWAHDWQRQTGNRPLLVHCMDGVERTGLFCVLYALLERTKTEHDVAIAQVIQEMRSRRQNIIPNWEQYQFCHEVVLEFLNQFQTYSNFVQ